MTPNHENSILIIGSGPAGVSAAYALLNRGCKVVMLDVGIQLDKNTQEKLDYFQRTADSTVLPDLKSNLDTADHIKLVYASDYVYKEPKWIHFITDEQTFCKPSFAQGGLSNAWGAFLNEYAAEDMAGWPITTEKLAPYYPKILEFMPMAGNRDHQQGMANSYWPSRQAAFLLNQFSAHTAQLNAAGFAYGAAKLAVKFADNGQPLCVYWGRCQYGCPYSLIYSAAQTLRELTQHEHFSYVDKIFVQKLTETQDGLLIQAYHVDSAEALVWKAARVFLAAGAISSTVLLLNSLNISAPVAMQDSQHFMFPCLMFKKLNNPTQEKLHTLCQLYLTLKSEPILQKTCHLQIYTYMEQYENQFKKMLGKLYPYFKFLITPLLCRMIVIQGFLHSQDSHQFSLQVKSDSANKTAVSVKIINNPTVNKKINAIIAHLFQHVRLLGFFPIKLFLKISKPGRSYHYGGSFPMSTHPSQFETDLMGKPNGFKRLHVVDATIFPTIPAQAITFSIMANAYRIASECDLNENQ